MPQFVRVGQLAEQVRGVTFSKADGQSAPGPGLVPVLTASNITEQGLALDSLIHVPAQKVSDRQFLKRNDLVITASSGSLSVVGRSAMVKEDLVAAFGAFCKVLRPTDRVEPNYFAHYFRTPQYRARVSRLAAGANINNLRNEDLENLEIPLPPLPEQRRIAAILDQADELRTKRRQAVVLLEEAAMTSFAELVSTAREFRRLRDCGLSFSSGKSVVASGGDGHSTNRVLKVSAVSGGMFDPSQSKALPSDYDPPSGHEVRVGDLLFTRASGSVDLIGISAFVDVDTAALYLPDKIWRVHFAQNADIVPEFAHMLFKQAAFRSHVLNASSGAAGVRNISQSKVLGYSFALPSLGGQRAFAARFSKLTEMISMHRAHLAKLDELFASLQQRAFTGQL